MQLVARVIDYTNDLKKEAKEDGSLSLAILLVFTHFLLVIFIMAIIVLASIGLILVPISLKLVLIILGWLFYISVKWIMS